MAKGDKEQFKDRFKQKITAELCAGWEYPTLYGKLYNEYKTPNVSPEQVIKFLGKFDNEIEDYYDYTVQCIKDAESN